MIDGWWGFVVGVYILDEDCVGNIGCIVDLIWDFVKVVVVMICI